ncbi:MAG: hypothetical protein ABS882_00485 [Lysinibacillus sp.]
MANREWLYCLNEAQYERLLTVLFTHCDTITCIGMEEQVEVWHGLSYECIGKQLSDVPLIQYSFICDEKMKKFFQQQHFYRLYWQMIQLESIAFWKKGQCVFRAITERFVKVEMNPALEQQIVYLFN